ncbi:MAG TPA: 4-hydroxy-3-methylbut-2-enyl diphosphate reductase, partial [Vampirovibrionales bacterium]
GVPPEFYTKAKKQGLYILDATCPLVRKVHLEAIRYAKLGYTILYIGHKGHDEAVGVLAEAPDSMILVDNLDDAAKVKPQQQEKLIYLTQTTLSVNETSEIIKVLKQRFPSLQDPPKEDICYATTNRQLAVRSLAKNCDLVLVLGSQNSSNSLRLKECAEEEGAQAFLIDSYVEFDESWLDGVETIGITAGASAPEQLVKELLQFLKEEYNIESSSEQDIIKENMFFPVPNLKKQKEHQALEN